MIRGLQITILGEELSRRIAERIQIHEMAVSALDVRINERAGDQPFDIRVEDGLKTLGELEGERQNHRDRMTQLTLIRNGLAGEEIYVLNRADMRLAELISGESRDDASSADDGSIDNRRNETINGLRLTIPGVELLRMLEERIEDHKRRAENWKREQARTPEEETEEEPLLPDHICANEAERHEWRAEVLGFIRAHVESGGIYRLGKADLAFGELLPEKPGWLEQDEYQERTSVGFNLGRLVKSVGGLGSIGSALAARDESAAE